MELNKEKTIKGLEICANEYLNTCNDCPYTEDYINCHQLLAKDALAIIKAQDQNIFELEKRIAENENGYAQTLFLEKCKNKDLTDELKKIKKAKYIFATVDYCSDDLAAAIKENKRLAEENKKLYEENEKYRKFKQFIEYCGGSLSILNRGSSFVIMSDKLDKKIKEREKENRFITIEEFAERLKAAFPSISGAIDYIAKGMKGD